MSVKLAPYYLKKIDTTLHRDGSHPSEKQQPRQTTEVKQNRNEVEMIRLKALGKIGLVTQMVRFKISAA